MNISVLRPAAWVGAGAMALALVAGGSYAAGKYDAQNADKVDGRDAVGAKAGKAQRAGKLVATDKQGRVPDSQKFGGYTHSQTATLSIPPQAAVTNGAATAALAGPTLSASSTSGISVSFVVPPDHKPGAPLHMVVKYIEQSSDACSWYVYTSGLEGPDADNSQPNVHNGGWQPPGLTGYEGLVQVPAGAGSAHSATFTWPFGAKPGMFVQFYLQRLGGDAGDTCSTVQVSGLQLRY